MIRRVMVSVAIGVLSVGLGTGTAVAHNHVLNPSGACNQSPNGDDGPGATSDAENPAGKPVGQSEAFDKGNAESAPC